MIAPETIKKLAVKHQTTELNILREYFQHLFLSYFYQQKESAKIYFKGGTALRIIYQSPRFSEDLDFSSTLKDVSVLEKIIIAALSEIEKEAVRNEIREAKKTSGGYLAIIDFFVENKIVSVQLEISFRDKKMKGETIVVAADFLPPYTLAQLTLDQLVEEKIEALLSRQKPRDFYDLYFILRAGLLPVSRRDKLEEILKLLEKTSINFEKELKAFLPKSHRAIIRDFSNTLKRELKRFM